MKIGIIGLGAIGGYVAERALNDKTIELVFVMDMDENKTSKFQKNIVLGSIEKMPKVDLVIECAGDGAVKQYGAKILEKSNLLIMSGSALADKKTLGAIEAACKKHETKVFMASGAIAGLDGISSAREGLQDVEIITRKNPKGFKREDTVETILFEGKAHEACEKFPKNVNVSATLSMNGLGFDKTRVKIISDPNAKANTHSITASGEFGKITIVVEAKPSANAATSGLAAMSAWETVKKIQKGFATIG
jgi:aspartate dehydrogenase